MGGVEFLVVLFFFRLVPLVEEEVEEEVVEEVEEEVVEEVVEIGL